MEIVVSSESDSDDCQLYTRAAENVGLKKKTLQAKLDEFEQAIHLVSDDEVENITKEVNVENSPSKLINNVLRKAKVNSVEDELPPVTLRRSLRNKGKVQNAPKSLNKSKITKTKKRSKRTSSIPPPSGLRDLGTVVLDDDTGYSTDFLKPINFKEQSTNKNTHADDSFNNISLNSNLSYESDDGESDEDIITLSVEWNNGKQIARKGFKLRKYQKFDSIFDELAKTENVPRNRILLMHNFNSVRPSDTPSSLKLNLYGALTGSIAVTEINYDKPNSDDLDLVQNTDNESKEHLKVKLQLESKQTLFLNVMKNQKISVLYFKCAEELNYEESRLRLTFDGDFADPNDLISDLEVEDGDVFHVHIK